MGTWVSISEAARRVVTWDGKSISSEAIANWIYTKDLPTYQQAIGTKGKWRYVINLVDLRRFLADYSMYRLREDPPDIPPVAEMLDYVRDLLQRMADLEAEYEELCTIEQSLDVAFVGEKPTPRPAVSPRSAPVHAPREGAWRATLSPAYRGFWVGRGDVGDYFAFFMYVHLAHGLNTSTANTHRRFARKAAEGGTISLYPCTVAPPGLNGGEERILVTEDQARININVIHNRVRQASGGSYPPPEFLCQDSHCPCCPAIWATIERSGE